jgi:two-component system, cell cycle response regulator CtrA
MKVLASGLDAVTTSFLREHGVLLEQEEVASVDEFTDLLADGLYDVGVVDLEQSGIGIYAARGLRVRKLLTPIVGISRGSEERPWGDHRALFLENGGDDLLRAPVHPRELTASLRAVTRRFKGALMDIIECRYKEASLKVNLTTRSVIVNGLSIDLTSKERSLMLLFASTPGRVLSKEMILGQLYTGGVNDEPKMKIIDVFIFKLRRKLTDVHPDAAAFIATEWGRGYRLPEQSELFT